MQTTELPDLLDDWVRPPDRKLLAQDSTGAIGFFEAWGRAAASRPTKSLSPDSIQHYRSTWTVWLAWLAKKNTDWRIASAQEVTQFLSDIPSSAASRIRKHNLGARGASPVTRRRYWRMLRDIYSHAVIQEICQENPCADVTDKPLSEVVPSLILPESTLRAIRDGVLHDNKQRKKSSWQELRDDVLLLILLETAAKTGELAQLRNDQVSPILSNGARHISITIDGEHSYQKRQIIVKNPKVIALIDRWVLERKEVPLVPGWFFFGAKSTLVANRKERSALSNKSIFLTVSRAVASHYQAAGSSSELQHVGAETLRNSVLKAWLNQGTSVEEVQKRAGLKDLRALSRLGVRQSNAAET